MQRAADRYALNSDSFDQPPFRGDRRCYMICAAPRSGSTLLCRLLMQTGRMGVPHEYFHWHDYAPKLMARLGFASEGQKRVKVATVAAYIDRIKDIRTTENGVFGFSVEDTNQTRLADQENEQWVARYRAHRPAVHKRRKATPDGGDGNARQPP